MADPIAIYLRQSLPREIVDLTEPYLTRLEQGEYEDLLSDPQAQALFGHTEEERLAAIKLEDFPSWSDYIFQRLGASMADRSMPALGKQVMFWCIGYAALLAFLQSSVTGPPLAFESAKLVLPTEVAESTQRTRSVRQTLLESFKMDGIAAYRLTPNVELLCLADAIMTTPPILKNLNAARWAKLRIAFVQQRLLSEVSSALQNVIYDDLDLLEPEILSLNDSSTMQILVKEDFLLERSTIHTHHGLDKLARADLERVTKLREFRFKLTGLLGKRTKYQRDDLSQMVVLAKSKEGSEETDFTSAEGTGIEAIKEVPKTIDLDDDTLLDSISFSRRTDSSSAATDDDIPAALASLDPSNQPLLQPLDSAILLSLASSITNTSPQDGLTREETLPYATRVLEGGSSNWQVYTQALLVRSRIEGYRARTTERGLLQLQALVDQVISDTTGSANASEGTDQASTFLPRAKDSESAAASERLRYVFQLASPARWDLEAELAARWTQLGGLRSALDIYERLEMWAEAALCWAATEREDKARRMIRRQLFHATKNGPEEPEADADDETWDGPARDPPPSDAARLYCILGDIDSSPEMYEKAWQVSNQRYARAQRSIGRYYLASKDFVKAADAYAKSLKANQLNHGSWFALGCVLLELGQYEKAVEAFSRCVQLDDTDAESWSNLAAALLRKEPDVEEETPGPLLADDEDESLSATAQKDVNTVIKQNRQDALNALKRAATLKHDSYQIWQNVLIVAASTVPPDYQSLLTAQKRVIDLRGPTEGEKCIDFEILEALVQHIISIDDSYDVSQPGLPRIVVKFVDESIIPLITNSAPLWRLVSKLALWRNKPGSALDAEEKAWRAITSQPGWETESEGLWNEVVEATVRLCDSYESLGPRERTEGMAAGAGESVARDWKFKARSAVRGIMGRGKGSWDGTDGWERLKEAIDGLRG